MWFLLSENRYIFVTQSLRDRSLSVPLVSPLQVRVLNHSKIILGCRFMSKLGQNGLQIKQIDQKWAHQNES